MKTVKNKQWYRFMKFVKWYTKQGGRALTPQEISNIIIKFENAQTPEGLKVIVPDKRIN